MFTFALPNKSILEMFQDALWCMHVRQPAEMKVWCVLD